MDWCIGIMAANEAKSIGTCLASVDAASKGRNCHVSLMLNGASDSTVEAIKQISLKSIALSVYSHPLADKANAINQFLHRFRPEAPIIFMVDAYVRIEPTALALLDDALVRAPEVFIASGVPRNGRSAASYRQALLKGGNINGNLFAMRQSFASALTARHYCLPNGIYRTDSLLGSMAAHNLDAMCQPWDAKRLMGVDEAGYHISPLSPLRRSDWQRWFRRQIRQARGAMENEAVRDLIYTAGYDALPDDADAMLRAWLLEHTPSPPSKTQRAFLQLALRELRKERRLAERATESFSLVFHANSYRAVLRN